WPNSLHPLPPAPASNVPRSASRLRQFSATTRPWQKKARPDRGLYRRAKESRVECAHEARNLKSSQDGKQRDWEVSVHPLSVRCPAASQEPIRPSPPAESKEHFKKLEY